MPTPPTPARQTLRAWTVRTRCFRRSEKVGFFGGGASMRAAICRPSGAVFFAEGRGLQISRFSRPTPCKCSRQQGEAVRAPQQVRSVANARGGNKKKNLIRSLQPV